MSTKYLKTDTLDIHAGGRDLIFPHHENEIAQAQALTGKPFAKYWIHHGLLTINGQKMAKSLGNFVTIKDFIAKYHDANLLKLFFLSAHYAHPIDYNEDKIEETRQAFERIIILLQKIEKKVTGSAGHPFDSARGRQVTSKKIKEIEKVKEKFINAMDDDFNTPLGLASIFDLVNIANKNINNPEFIKSAKSTLKDLLGIFGIADKIEVSLREAVEIDQEIKAKIQERERARRNKDFALSDKLRKELEEKGVILEDTKEGTTWRRKI
jgi:cysteinyl-tRNA synthetase